MVRLPSVPMTIAPGAPGAEAGGAAIVRGTSRPFGAGRATVAPASCNARAISPRPGIQEQVHGTWKDGAHRDAHGSPVGGPAHCRVTGLRPPSAAARRAAPVRVVD